MPHHYKEFRCIGGICEDNCCVGWDVEIDQKTYREYQKEKDQELSVLFRRSIHKNPSCYNPNIDYAIVTLAAQNRCPFLNEQQLCKIQARLGHDRLSNVCAAYPRYANEVDGILEYSINVSCPEAARLILTDRRGILFETAEEARDSRTIINMTVNTAEYPGNLMGKHFTELREFTITLLQDRKYPLRDRLLMLGRCFEELQKPIHKNDSTRLQALLKEYYEKAGYEKFQLDRSAAVKNQETPSQFRVLNELIDRMDRVTSIDSKRFIKSAQEFSKGIGISKRSDPETESKAYETAYVQYYKPFMEQHEHLLENYLVNYVFGSLFPAAESKNLSDAYLLLVMRFALIQYYLVGIAAYHKGLSEEKCVQFIQIFSKAIEHHHTYLQDMASLMKKKHYNSLPFLHSVLVNE